MSKTIHFLIKRDAACLPAGRVRDRSRATKPGSVTWASDLEEWMSGGHSSKWTASGREAKANKERLQTNYW